MRTWYVQNDLILKIQDGGKESGRKNIIFFFFKNHLGYFYKILCIFQEHKVPNNPNSLQNLRKKLHFFHRYIFKTKAFYIHKIFVLS